MPRRAVLLAQGPGKLTGSNLDHFAFFLSDVRPTPLDVVATGPLIAVLIWLSVTDWREFRLPDIGTLPLIAIGVLLAMWRGGDLGLDHLIGAGAGFALFAAIGAAYFRTRGVDALGLGDAKLLAAAGAWLGWQALAPVILIAALAGIVVALARGAGRGAHIPFGPPLAAAFAGIWIFFLATS